MMRCHTDRSVSSAYERMRCRSSPAEVVPASALWAGSDYVGGSTSHLRIPTSHSLGDDLHVVAGDGSIYLFDQFESDASGNVRPMVVDLKTHIAPKVRRIGTGLTRIAARSVPNSNEPTADTRNSWMVPANADP